MKSFVLLVICTVVVGTQAYQDDLKCNFRICGSELLNFDGFSISGMFRKLELGSFCIKNCTPPVVHEFFQSIIFAVTRRIPGHCSGHECTDKNRFVSLAKCVHEKAWPLLQCSKRLVDLAQVVFEVHDNRQKRNYTCSITVETSQCIEEILQECGTHPFSLAKEIFGDVVRLGIKAYCPNSYKNDFFIEHMTTALPPYQERLKTFTDISPAPGPHPYPQFVKGYRQNNAAGSAVVSAVCLVVGLVGSVFMLRMR